MRPPHRALFVANDGLGAGHVTRSLAVAHELTAWMATHETPFSWLLATTSEADALLRTSPGATVRLPSPGAARRQGLGRADYRRLQQSTLRGVIDGFRPDLLVVDTFPSGPHLELDGLLDRVPRRALLQRTVAPSTWTSPEMTTGRAHFQVTLAPADPTPQPGPARTARVIEPIVLGGPQLDRAAARRTLGLDEYTPAAVVIPGGGGDTDAFDDAARLVASLRRRGLTTLLAAGPLAHTHPEQNRLGPLWPVFLAFDRAVAMAGYNTAHELAASGVKAALWGRPRPFDDQLARARRFDDAGLAVALDDLADDALDHALARLDAMPPPRLSCRGAAQAADVLGRWLVEES